MAKHIIMPKPDPELEEQMQHILAFVTTLERDIEDPEKREDWMENEIRMQRAIYKSLCVSKWVVENSTTSLLKYPGNQPEKQHNQCWIPFFLVSDRRWTIVKVSRGIGMFEYHPLGDVATEAEAIDWADNENYSDFQLEDEEIIADILKGTTFEKEVHHG